ncbi:hypothetical protein HMI01_28730 [Halolactibacillus miurensis]|uniref:Uncharacterized protein n=1 Tax=Halolactibacillus miurensis TaxID=306541 RepID=A0A1I6UXQ2_9BACI|nr:hypothetical protein [Halolactibacillus miurensis]GEM05885.1 hypothetical protein HMI01_28730 [Halolactibacillus miurensis]SFT06198.1 hypothetical protein SAMN05421668_1369 [Halolactibacillus miurensis]
MKKVRIVLMASSLALMLLTGIMQQEILALPEENITHDLPNQH